MFCTPLTQPSPRTTLLHAMLGAALSGIIHTTQTKQVLVSCSRLSKLLWRFNGTSPDSETTMYEVWVWAVLVSVVVLECWWYECRLMMWWEWVGPLYDAGPAHTQKVAILGRATKTFECCIAGDEKVFPVCATHPSHDHSLGHDPPECDTVNSQCFARITAWVHYLQS